MDLKHLCRPEDAKHSECRDNMQEIYKQAAVASVPELRSCSHDDIFKLSTCDVFNTQEKDASNALFPIFSRAAHSCSPNCMAMHPLNQQESFFMACKPIAPGDMLTIPYNKTSLSTIARRTELRSAVVSIGDPVPDPPPPLLAPYQMYITWIIQACSRSYMSTI
jgi:hypothetical protein